MLKDIWFFNPFQTHGKFSRAVLAGSENCGSTGRKTCLTGDFEVFILFLESRNKKTKTYLMYNLSLMYLLSGSNVSGLTVNTLLTVMLSSSVLNPSTVIHLLVSIALKRILIFLILSINNMSKC